MRIFGSTYYVKVSGEYKDVEPNEKYLQLEVKSTWDFNLNKNYLFCKGGFCYYIVMQSKSDNSVFNYHKYLKKEDITEGILELINSNL